jgi:glycosyltransferase involved in cell wall biosynthesis
MRIGLITPGFSADERDWCIPAQLDLVRLLARQAEVAVFPLRYPHRRQPYAVYGAAVHPQGGALARGVRRLPLLLRGLRALVREHRRRPFDLLHALWADEPGALACLAARRLGLPAVVSICGGELVGYPALGYGGQLGRINRQLTRYALASAKIVTAGSAYLEQLAAPQVPAQRLARLPLGYDPALFHPDMAQGVATLAGQVKLLHVAGLAPVKDQATLLRGFALAAAQVAGLHLHIVGEGPLRAQLEALATSLGSAGQVTFHGAVGHEQLPAYYRAADLCLLSSLHESQGMVVLEAAGCGRSTLGTAVGIVPELQPATRAVPVADPQALGQALAALAGEPALLAELGRRCHERVLSEYTVDHMMERIKVIYKA